MRAFVWTQRAVIVAACVWVAPRLAVAGPKPPARRPTGDQQEGEGGPDHGGPAVLPLLPPCRHFYPKI